MVHDTAMAILAVFYISSLKHPHQEQYPVGTTHEQERDGTCWLERERERELVVSRLNT